MSENKKKCNYCWKDTEEELVLNELNHTVHQSCYDKFVKEKEESEESIRMCYGICYFNEGENTWHQAYRVKIGNNANKLPENYKGKEIENIPIVFIDQLHHSHVLRAEQDGVLSFTYGTIDSMDATIHALAISHEKDNFSKKGGRSIIESRLKCTKKWFSNHFTNLNNLMGCRSRSISPMILITKKVE